MTSMWSSVLSETMIFSQPGFHQFHTLACFGMAMNYKCNWIENKENMLEKTKVFFFICPRKILCKDRKKGLCNHPTSWSFMPFCRQHILKLVEHCRAKFSRSWMSLHHKGESSHPFLSAWCTKVKVCRATKKLNHEKKQAHPHAILSLYF